MTIPPAFRVSGNRKPDTGGGRERTHFNRAADGDVQFHRPGRLLSFDTRQSSYQALQPHPVDAAVACKTWVSVMMRTTAGAFRYSNSTGTPLGAWIVDAVPAASQDGPHTTNEWRPYRQFRPIRTTS